MEQPTVGTVLAGSYRLIARIGDGAMGTVWRAARVDGGADVAVKLLSAELQNRPDLALRFEREAALAREIEHPAVCRVYEHGKTEHGGYFLAMELLEGQSLAERLSSDPPSAEEFLVSMMVILEGLSAVHLAGIVHRDLKPDNIFLTTESGPKLIDFGVSKGGDAAQKLTATGEVLGTPVFMAPEQADSAKTVTPSADVYGIGAILYDALAGRPPFESKSLAMLLLAVAFEDPAPLEDARPGIPIELATLTHRAMSKAVGDRPASASALRDALGEVVETHRAALATLDLPRAPVEAETKSVVESEAEPGGEPSVLRTRSRLLAGVAALLVAIGAVVVYAVLW